jgi:ABC-2 type transport system ATP-binding protein
VAPVIAADRLTKSYGASRGIVDLTFAVERGEVFGFLGPNGAGKTTTIRTMLDLIRPTSGDLTVFGMRPREDAAAIHARIGYLPGKLALYERMTGGAFLDAFASFRGGLPRTRIEALAERIDLDLSKPIRALSHGNKQKIGLVQTFMHEPELVILDEPTQGLDPLIQQEFYAIVDEARARGATVFLSSHILPEVERVCDRVAIIREGRLVTVADIADLKEQALRRLELRFDEPVPVDAFTALPSVRDVDAHAETIRLTVQGIADPVIKEAARHTVVSVTSEEPNLEEIFLAIYRDGTHARTPDGRAAGRSGDGDARSEDAR